ncbi:hypothetical protein Q8A64_01935 [Oxalobacteraceae bacterium R-40]|uniref:Uncharacterized protein n=1 Tax=Keguizhuia sedimenti TaxID=3064264 RepID=A0ABU1BLF9_9BURK|nr:hypothetical protein [Oxalobacteraceae bacterium R-40]
MNKPAKKLLLAVRPIDLPVVSAVLGDGFDVTIAHRLDDAKARLNAEIGLIACGVHFDEGMMFELLNAARSNPLTKSTPFYVLFKEEQGYSRPIIDGIRSASKLLGATDFIDLLKMAQELGEDNAKEVIRKSISEVLEQSSQDKAWKSVERF